MNANQNRAKAEKVKNRIAKAGPQHNGNQTARPK